MISLIQHFEADFLWKVSLKILNSGIILKTSTHVKRLNLILVSLLESLTVYNMLSESVNSSSLIFNINIATIQ